MTEKPEIVSGSLLYLQRRLFTQLELEVVLREKRNQALRQFKRGLARSDVDQLIERIYDRFMSYPLWLDDKVMHRSSWDRSDGCTENEFAVRFGGDAIFWDCSPVPIDDRLPAGCTYDEWYLEPGETLNHPYGEVFRNHLILIASEVTADDLKPYRKILRAQTRMVDRANEELLAELHSLGRVKKGKRPH